MPAYRGKRSSGRSLTYESYFWSTPSLAALPFGVLRTREPPGAIPGVAGGPTPAASGEERVHDGLNPCSWVGLGSGLPATVDRAPSTLGGLRPPLAPTGVGNDFGPGPQVLRRPHVPTVARARRPASPGQRQAARATSYPRRQQRDDQWVSDNTRRADGPDRDIGHPRGWLGCTLVPRHGSPGLSDAHRQ